MRDSLWYTLRVAALSSLGACAVGTAIAVCLAYVGRASAWLRLSTQWPLGIPHVVAGYMVLTLLAPTGLIARLLHAVGVAAEPGQMPAWSHDAFGWGIISAYVFKESPFVAVLVYPLVGAAVRRLQEAAAPLGATPLQAFRHMVWPLIRPGVLATGLIVFAYTVGAFEIPYVLGRTYPRALPVLAYQKYTSIDLADRPVAMALAVLLTAIAGAAAAAWLRVAGAAGLQLGRVRGGRDD